ncbi:MAG: glycerol-3-phosphate dehydrogenase [Alphaproteobacteria bacterium]|nr:glycerol-3-phosphate dehydrogenase [Alphaproteobacteria bacterium]
MREGSLGAPTRHALAWRDADFYDPAKLEAEMRRVFDICHGCRRCFNLCDSFPRLFDLIDQSSTGELDGVATKDFKAVVDACTLCDMCFMTKCPYVPPHEFNLDFPHLMLRARGVSWKQGEVPFTDRELVRTDRNGSLATMVAPLANWATSTHNTLTRSLLERLAGVDRRAHLPEYAGKTFLSRAKAAPPAVDPAGPATGRKAVLFATCVVNYNQPDIGMAALQVLARFGVAAEVVYPGCCGMPQLEQGNVADVADRARTTAQALAPFIEQGYDVVSLTPSCSLMAKSEWPLLEPEDADVLRLSRAVFDIDEYIVELARKHGLPAGLGGLDGGVTVHLACHARALNVGPKAAELLRLIPGADIAVIERCSGHGGSWGVKVGNFDVALKVGKPVARQAVRAAKRYVASECPLAAQHIAQGMALLAEDGAPPPRTHHPIELFARALLPRAEGSETP